MKNLGKKFKLAKIRILFINYEIKSETNKMREEFLPFITFILNLIRNTNGFYKLYPASVSFLEAVRICNSINATVVFINDSSEDLFIHDNYLKNASVSTGIWLAIYDFIGNEKNVNYYTNQTLTYTNWYLMGRIEPNDRLHYCVRYDKNKQKWADTSCDTPYSVLCESEKDDTYSTQDITTTISSTTISSTTIISTKELTITTSVLRSISSTTMISTTIFKITSTTNVFKSSTIKVTSIIYTSESKNTKKMNISFWNEWSSWSLCQLYRQRNNSNMSNGIQYEILNVSCSLICE
jgi:hypothetical protein